MIYIMIIPKNLLSFNLFILTKQNKSKEITRK
nr:MAG TPA: hypothetical protein [Caudoviricetes sp.]